MFACTYMAKAVVVPTVAPVLPLAQLRDTCSLLDFFTGRAGFDAPTSFEVIDAPLSLSATLLISLIVLCIGGVAVAATFALLPKTYVTVPLFERRRTCRTRDEHAALANDKLRAFAHLGFQEVLEMRQRSVYAASLWRRLKAPLGPSSRWQLATPPSYTAELLPTGSYDAERHRQEEAKRASGEGFTSDLSSSEKSCHDVFVSEEALKTAILMKHETRKMLRRDFLHGATAYAFSFLALGRGTDGAFADFLPARQIFFLTFHGLRQTLPFWDRRVNWCFQLFFATLAKVDIAAFFWLTTHLLEAVEAANANAAEIAELLQLQIAAVAAHARQPAAAASAGATAAADDAPVALLPLLPRVPRARTLLNSTMLPLLQQAFTFSSEIGAPLPLLGFVMQTMLVDSQDLPSPNDDDEKLFRLLWALSAVVSAAAGAAAAARKKVELAAAAAPTGTGIPGGGSSSFTGVATAMAAMAKASAAWRDDRDLAAAAAVPMAAFVAHLRVERRAAMGVRLW